jgi:cytochrome c-type biogenesis protein
MLTQFTQAEAITLAMLALVFVEGIVAFLSPCVLPMLPVYLLYLGGDAAPTDQKKKRRLLANTGGFILGFTLLFLALGAGATALGRVLQQYQERFIQLGGVVLILLGLQAMGVLKALHLPVRAAKAPTQALTPLRAVAFGAALAVTWGPCVGVQLGVALTMAAQSASLWNGLLMLLCFSLGLGVPFVLLALLYDRLAGALGWVKRHMRGIQLISGGLLVAFGLLMLFGAFGLWSSLFQ